MHELCDADVMVMGGAGFVGSAVVRELIGTARSVISYDNYQHGWPQNVADLPDNFVAVQGDILDSWRLLESLREHHVEYIIHCVGDTYVPSAYDVPKRFFDINLIGTLNVLMAAKAVGVKRAVYLSSTEVYGRCDKPFIAETDALMPSNTYAVSKLAADRLCATFHLEHGLPVVIARMFNCYGPRETHPYVIPEIIAQLSRGRALSLGNVGAERDFTYVHDTAKALIALLVSEVPNGDVVNVGSGTLYSVEWLARTIAEMMSVEDLVITTDVERLRRCDIDRFRCNNAKLKEYTSWAPRVSIEDGLKATIDWYKANNCQWPWEIVSHDMGNSARPRVSVSNDTLVRRSKREAQNV